MVSCFRQLKCLNRLLARFWTRLAENGSRGCPRIDARGVGRHLTPRKTRCVRIGSSSSSPSWQLAFSHRSCSPAAEIRSGRRLIDRHRITWRAAPRSEIQRPTVEVELQTVCSWLTSPRAEIQTRTRSSWLTCSAAPPAPRAAAPPRGSEHRPGTTRDHVRLESLVVSPAIHGEALTHPGGYLVATTTAMIGTADWSRIWATRSPKRPEWSQAPCSGRPCCRATRFSLRATRLRPCYRFSFTGST